LLLLEANGELEFQEATAWLLVCAVLLLLVPFVWELEEEEEEKRVCFEHCLQLDFAISAVAN
jgi:hypothetical protein